MAVQSPVAKPKTNIPFPNDFEPACNTKISSLLRTVDPFGGTCMRDAVLLSIERVVHLSDKCSKSNQIIPYSFKIIVVTDGADNCSWQTATMLSENLEKYTTGRSVDDINIVFITLDLNKHDQANLDLRGITYNSQKHSVMLEQQTATLEEIFEREIIQKMELSASEKIEEDLGDGKRIIIRREQSESVHIIAEKKFAVTFCLDISGSMTENNRWPTLINCVDKLTRELAKDKENLIDCILFNHTIVHYSHPHFLKKFLYEAGNFCENWKPACFAITCPFFGVCCLQECAGSKALGRPFKFSRVGIHLLCCCISMSLNRRKIRKTYNIPGSCIRDCCGYMLCMCCCYAVQEYREAITRGIGLYSLY